MEPLVSHRSRFHQKKKGSGVRELGPLVTEITQIQSDTHRGVVVVVDLSRLGCRAQYRERWGPRAKIRNAERSASDPDLASRTLTERGDSCGGAAASELN
jgi:hypothetical protein